MSMEAYYAASCAQDVDTAEVYSSDLSNLCALVGSVMNAAANQARDNGCDFWPVAGAEYAAEVINCYKGGPEYREALMQLQADAVHAALIGGASEGNGYKLKSVAHSAT